MFDNHIHIGQFNEVYYDGIEVIETVMAAGMDGLAFSSTTSCADNVLYGEIEKEIRTLLKKIACPSENIKPFLWYIPDYIKQKITVQSAFASIPYQGIKLHPYAHNWDFANNAHIETLHNLFDYAALHHLPILIHSGESGVDSADRFERFFTEYRSVSCVLAHCRPLSAALVMLEKHANVLCDTAFVPEADLRRIVSAGFTQRVVFGTDFPITHYFAEKHGRSAITLQEQYAIDIL